MLTEYKRMEQCESAAGQVYPAEGTPCPPADGTVPLPDCGGYPPPVSYTPPTPQLGTFTITLTTTWSGQYQIAGATTWHPITGTATTTTSHPPVTIHESRSHLVADTCHDNPTAPGC
ncbi:hypothetical protein [Cellulomonas timonensis]|uniref:hypothetical protein n=1 Tax=Cellulomonas timonensis TaxID=1689271 RepID=UPI0011C87208|nr:hypothetical protein [Cellulomonas timonensis]